MNKTLEELIALCGPHFEVLWKEFDFNGEFVGWIAGGHDWNHVVAYRPFGVGKTPKEALEDLYNKVNLKTS